MLRTYVFSEISVKINKKDEVNPEIQLFNSYDTTWPFIVLLGAFRLVCENGLVVGEKFLDLRKRHEFDFDQIQLNKQVSTALNRFERQTREWMKWVNRQLTETTYNRIMKAMKFGKNATEEDGYNHDITQFPIRPSK
jgi:hypothetical protein